MLVAWAAREALYLRMSGRQEEPMTERVREWEDPDLDNAIELLEAYSHDEEEQSE